ncbi:alcohol dehydrogenase catalytic domain-containing protein [Paracoccus sp. Z330]|uniref:Alcohol dehydrogenase catalytic domain-containing protein n=1 Tax=Paracoccus onchidii TaxID=3017813 RepID=A0ABT4ZGE2_9RHOB|nr:alcohol dehydrogenase catalytic domain-containing protein [Paracoccus onchidii]MDB6178377.1 alcohol dehydrogenase catalytic domain-containing protein [Paracoccus onchidii]
MKALIYHGARDVRVEDVAHRHDPAKVGLRLRYCGVCGTDIGIFSGKHPRAAAPLVIGHEFVGTVCDPLPEGRFSTGDRVVAYPLISCGNCYPCRNGSPHVCQTLRLIGIDCDGGMAEHVDVPEADLFAIPAALSDEVAALIEPLAVVVHSLYKAEFQPFDSCLIMGAGPIGLLTAIVARHAGAGRLLISDIDEARLSICRELGFETVNVARESLAERVAQVTNGDGMGLIFECSGVASAAIEMSELARVGGTICVTATHKDAHPVRLIDVNFKELRVIGCRVYTKEDYARSIDLAVELQDELRSIITQIVPLSEAGKVFDMIADPSLTTVKILVDCS